MKAAHTAPPWLDTQEYPFAAHAFETDGQALHYVAEGQGPTLVFVHGTPSWSFDFRHLIKAMRTHYRCLALDHLGFGLSEKPAHGNYSLEAHVQRFTAWMNHVAPHPVTLVVHDFGGPIALEWALRHPDRVQRLVILNTWMWSAEQDPAFKKLKPVLKSPLLPFLYRYLNFSPRFLLPASFYNKKILTTALRRQYMRPFPNANARYGPLAFAKSLLNDQPWFETQWERRQVLAHIPALLIWGMNDSFIGPQHLERMAFIFQNKQVLRIPQCGHFPQEEAPQQAIQAMHTFLTNEV